MGVSIQVLTEQGMTTTDECIQGFDKTRWCNYMKRQRASYKVQSMDSFTKYQVKIKYIIPLSQNFQTVIFRYLKQIYSDPSTSKPMQN